GKNREIRRMCEAVDLKVIRLKRNAEGPVKLGMLQPGKHRPLTKAEIAGLKASASKAVRKENTEAAQERAEKYKRKGPIRSR
ncbi:MAG: pseudouridine synthase, partial [Pygmaiobacter massiliensis]